MNILYTGDDSYAMITAVSVISLIENNRWDNDLHFYIVDAYQNKKNREKLKTLIEENGAYCHFIAEINYEDHMNEPIHYSRWCRVAFARLFLDELFCKYSDVHKILYIDCDTMIRGNLKSLWSTNLEEKTVAAVVREPFGKMHWKNLKLKRDTYFNNGVLLIDIDKWRKEKLDKAAADFLNARNGKVPYADQGVNNYILSDKVKYLHPKYNFMTMNIDMSYEEMLVFRKPEKHYMRETYMEAAKEPVIVHFTSCFLSQRVWICSSEHPYRKEWLIYKEKTPWKGEPCIEETLSWSSKCKKKILAVMPRKIMIYCAGFLHSYIKPIKDRL